MIFLADEGIDRQIVDRLRDEGHFVQYVAEMDPGISDDSVLEWANTQNALLLTADKDFGELVFRQRRASAGVILIRLSGLSAAHKAESVAKLVHEHGEEMAGSFSVIARSGTRIRRKM